MLVLVFLGELAMSIEGARVMAVTAPTLVLFGAMSSELVFQAGQWYRLVCSIFLHGSTAHLFANVVLLVIAGWFLEAVHVLKKKLNLIHGSNPNFYRCFWNYPPFYTSKSSNNPTTSNYSSLFINIYIYINFFSV